MRNVWARVSCIRDGSELHSKQQDAEIQYFEMSNDDRNNFP
jgi:hypothetical protein